jgi:hypothetical protein
MCTVRGDRLLGKLTIALFLRDGCAAVNPRQTGACCCKSRAGRPLRGAYDASKRHCETLALSVLPRRSIDECRCSLSKCLRPGVNQPYSITSVDSLRARSRIIPPRLTRGYSTPILTEGPVLGFGDTSNHLSCGVMSSPRVRQRRRFRG